MIYDIQNESKTEKRGWRGKRKKGKYNNLLKG